MRITLLTLVLIFYGQLCYSQVYFESGREGFTIEVPVQPTEKSDTVVTEFGRLPRYLMMAQIVDHGKNLLYIVEILDVSQVEVEIDMDKFRLHYIKRKSAGEMGFRLVSQEILSDTTSPFEIELVFADTHGMSLLFARLFERGSKFYSIETVQLKKSMNVGKRPGRLTQDYFGSFKLSDQNDKQ